MRRKTHNVSANRAENARPIHGTPIWRTSAVPDPPSLTVGVSCRLLRRKIDGSCPRSARPWIPIVSAVIPDKNRARRDIPAATTIQLPEFRVVVVGGGGGKGGMRGEMSSSANRSGMTPPPRARHRMRSRDRISDSPSHSPPIIVPAVANDPFVHSSCSRSVAPVAIMMGRRYDTDTRRREPPTPLRSVLFGTMRE